MSELFGFGKEGDLLGPPLKRRCFAERRPSVRASSLAVKSPVGNARDLIMSDPGANIFAALLSWKVEGTRARDSPGRERNGRYE